MSGPSVAFEVPKCWDFNILERSILLLGIGLYFFNQLVYGPGHGCREGGVSRLPFKQRIEHVREVLILGRVHLQIHQEFGRPFSARLVYELPVRSGT